MMPSVTSEVSQGKGVCAMAVFTGAASPFMASKRTRPVSTPANRI
ncbi:hypothetical protein AEGHOMDF_6055 [Methylobacterium soli]|nr:hypothetical protein AEGHOMDF_6055 [Methylobacterium soli]